MPIINGLSTQNALSNSLSGMQDVAQTQKQAALSPASAQPKAKTDKIEFTAQNTQNNQQAQPNQPLPLFSQEVQAGIGRIETIVKNGKSAPSNLVAGQQPSMENGANKGQLAQTKETQTKEQARAQATREQEFAKNSITSPANASISSAIKNLSAEQLNRSAQPQAQAVVQMMS